MEVSHLVELDEEPSHSHWSAIFGMTNLSSRRNLPPWANHEYIKEDNIYQDIATAQVNTGLIVDIAPLELLPLLSLRLIQLVIDYRSPLLHLVPNYTYRGRAGATVNVHYAWAAWLLVWPWPGTVDTDYRPSPDL